uniref:Uncharacterized protein n=1 Tax=Anguilla anguilla TaxID=7936 RepID=A0A0E9WG64_ANGAN
MTLFWAISITLPFNLSSFGSYRGLRSTVSPSAHPAPTFRMFL